MNVRDVMTAQPVTVAPEESAAVAARLLARHNIGALPVCGKDGRLRGMVTDRDIVLRCVAAQEDPRQVRVSEIMTRKIYTVGGSESLENASRLMSQQQIRRLPVQEDGRLVGMVSLGDLACQPGMDRRTAQALTGISGNIVSR